MGIRVKLPHTTSNTGADLFRRLAHSKSRFWFSHRLLTPMLAVTATMYSTSWDEATQGEESRGHQAPHGI